MPCVARCVGIADHHFIRVVPQGGIAEQDRAGRAHRIDRCVNRAVPVAPEPMSCHPRGVNVVTAALVVRVKRISQSRCRVRHRESVTVPPIFRKASGIPPARDSDPEKSPIIYPQHNRCRRVPGTS